MDLILTDDDISTLDGASGLSTQDAFDTAHLTQAQIAFLKALVAYIKTHPG